MKLSLAVTLLLFLALPMVYGQGAPNKPNHIKQLYVDEQDRLYIQEKEPVYLHLSTTPGLGASAKILKSAKQPELTNPMHFRGHGRQAIRHFDSELKKEIIFHVYADGLNPKSQLKFTGAPKFKKGEITYFGVGLNVKILSKDQLSGVRQNYLSINGNPFQTNPLPVSLSQEGPYTLYHYAVDNVGNVEDTSELSNLQVDLTPPSTGYRVDGVNLNDILNEKTVIVFESNDVLSGVSHIKYKFNEQNRYTRYRNQGLVRMEVLEDGDYTMAFHGVDNVLNAETDKFYSFYLDKIPPTVTLSVEGDQFRVTDNHYVSGRTNFRLTATDNKAGVENIQYGIDGQKALEYTKPIGLGSKGGSHTLGFFAADKVGNRSNKERIPFYLDLTSPVSQMILRGGYHSSSGTTYISSGTKITIFSSDKESGLQSMRYKLDGAKVKDVPEDPISIFAQGPHELFFYAVDRVNNREGAQYRSLYVDNLPPEIKPTFSIVADSGSMSGDSLGTVTRGEFLYLAATDENAGVDKISYSINDGVLSDYRSPLLLDKTGSFTIAISAVDKVGNASSKSISFNVRDE